MKSTKRALLVTIFKVPNYGSMLQAYATQVILEEAGCKCTVLNYDHINCEWSKKHGVKKQSIMNKIGRLLGLKPHHRKSNKLSAFAKRHLHLTKPYKSFHEIAKREGGKYDYYIVGSDQVWNSRFTNCDPVFLLDFVNDSNKIAISSSFASKVIDSNYISIYSNSLKKFKCISVREQNGIDILNSMGISNATLTLDPTLLLPASSWRTLIDKKKTSREKYILLYMWCYAFEPRPLIFEVLKHFKQKMGCNIIALEGYRECAECSDLNIKDATDSSVSDFLNLFANASLVVTSSFHGTAFALNFGRPLVSITPDGDDDRQGCLLKQLNLKQCELKISSNTISENLNPFYDVRAEQKALVSLRNRSIKIINQMVKS